MKKDSIKIKLHRYPTSEKSDVNKFKMNLFDNGKPEEFFLFMQNFERMLDPSVMLETNLKIQYIINLLHGEELFHSDTLCDQI